MEKSFTPALRGNITMNPVHKYLGSPAFVQHCKNKRDIINTVQFSVSEAPSRRDASEQNVAGGYRSRSRDIYSSFIETWVLWLHA